MKTLVIYHAGCCDGFCAAWIIRNALTGQEVEYHAAHYGTKPPDLAYDRDVRLFVVDFSYPRDTMFTLAAMRHQPMIVLDHHKTAMSALIDLDIELLSHNCGDALSLTFDMNLSGGRLTWNHFHPGKTAPWIVDYTEDRDLWKFALPESHEINAALRSYPLDFDIWDALAAFPAANLISEGAAIMRMQKRFINDHIRNAKEIMMNGHSILAVNATVLFSEIAGELAVGRPFGACYFDRGDGMRQWSLRSTANGLDVSEIAATHGGGGHRNAAGFEQAIALPSI